MFSQNYESALQAAADALGMERDWLYNVIAEESSWNPAAYNGSGAVGLIQFMPKTLKGLGLVSIQLANQIGSGPVPEAVKQAVRQEFLSKYPDAESQLAGPVRAYFRPYRPFDSAQSVYMTVLYPSYRNMSLDTALPANVQAANPGIETVGDYVAAVESRGSGGLASLGGTGIVPTTVVSTIALAAIGLGAYYIFRS